MLLKLSDRQVIHYVESSSRYRLYGYLDDRYSEVCDDPSQEEIELQPGTESILPHAISMKWESVHREVEDHPVQTEGVFYHPMEPFFLLSVDHKRTVLQCIGILI